MYVTCLSTIIKGFYLGQFIDQNTRPDKATFLGARWSLQAMVFQPR